MPVEKEPEPLPTKDIVVRWKHKILTSKQLQDTAAELQRIHKLSQPPSTVSTTTLHQIFTPCKQELLQELIDTRVPLDPPIVCEAWFAYLKDRVLEVLLKLAEEKITKEHSDDRIR
jgi:hypothetical protein